MNETNPLQGQTPKTKIPTLAIWSLVLGILSLSCLTVLAGLPAVICGHIARSRIETSGGALTGRGIATAGITLGYIGMAMILFYGLLAIVFPNFERAQDVALRKTCIDNLRQIDSAKQMWSKDNKKKATEIPTYQDLALYFALKTNEIARMPRCPAGGVYTIGSQKEAPRCSIPGHQLE